MMATGSLFCAADYVRLACMGGTSLRISIPDTENGGGQIEVRDGRLWAARSRRLKGDQAFQLLAEYQGACQVDTEPAVAEVGPRNVHGDYQSLLAEVAGLAPAAPATLSTPEEPASDWMPDLESAFEAHSNEQEDFEPASEMPFDEDFPDFQDPTDFQGSGDDLSQDEELEGQTMELLLNAERSVAALAESKQQLEAVLKILEGLVNQLYREVKGIHGTAASHPLAAILKETAFEDRGAELIIVEDDLLSLAPAIGMVGDHTDSDADAARSLTWSVAENTVKLTYSILHTLGERYSTSIAREQWTEVCVDFTNELISAARSAVNC